MWPISMFKKKHRETYLTRPNSKRLLKANISLGNPGVHLKVFRTISGLRGSFTAALGKDMRSLTSFLKQMA